MNVCFETFGCRLNRAEALEDEAKCLAKGDRIVDSHAEADVIVVRGCSVTRRAQRDCEKLIEHLRGRYPNKKIFITGCLDGAKKLVLKAPADALPTRTARAYLKVQDGCSGRCSFCIVPKFRGRSVSEDFTGLLDKAKRFLDAGYREIVVTGCNLSLYASEGRRLPELLDALCALDGSARVRLGSIEPGACASEVVDVMAARGNFCNFLHVPVQSASDSVLRAMNRPYSAAEATELLKKARRLVPSVMLGCDMISGFPGETMNDFMQSHRFLAMMQIANVHSFPYSARPGTAAAALPRQIDREERAERARTLGGLGETNREVFARGFVGKEVEVVIESEHRLAGWTAEYLWFESRGIAQLKSRRREKLRFRVRSADEGSLMGDPV